MYLSYGCLNTLCTNPGKSHRKDSNDSYCGRFFRHDGDTISHHAIFENPFYGNIPRMKASFHAGPNDNGKRIDVILRVLYPSVPLSALAAALRKSHIMVDGTPVRGKERITKGSTIVCTASFAQEFRVPKTLTAGSQKHSPRIIAKHPDFLVAQKPWGILSESFLSQVRTTLPPSSDLSFQPSTVHQLDRNTAGLLLISRNIKGARTLSAMFQNHKIHKEYLGIARGVLRKPVVWTESLARDERTATSYVERDGKKARTKVVPLTTWKKNRSSLSLLRYEPQTGRTHQIRAHTAAHELPLAGDYKYGGGRGRYFLLSWRLKFVYGGKYRQFTAIITREEREFMQKLGCMSAPREYEAG